MVAPHAVSVCFVHQLFWRYLKMLNSVNVIGNVGGHPEYKSFPSGKKVARFSLALNNYAKKDQPVWITCELWDERADRLQKCSVKTGTKIAVSGSLAMDEYTQTLGETQRKVRKLYVKVATFQVLSGKPEAEEEATDMDEVVEEEKPPAKATRKAS
jgi:single-strand DNA-binding protein